MLIAEIHELTGNSELTLREMKGRLGADIGGPDLTAQTLRRIRDDLYRSAGEKGWDTAGLDVRIESRREAIRSAWRQHKI